MDRPFRTEKVYRSIYLFFVQSRYSIQFDFIIIIILVTNLTNSYYCIIKINKYCVQLVVKISFVSLVPCSQISVSVCVKCSPIDGTYKTSTRLLLLPNSLNYCTLSLLFHKHCFKSNTSTHSERFRTQSRI